MGDYAAVVGIAKSDEPSSAELHVVRLSTRKAWRIRSRPGHAWGKVLLTSDLGIVVAEASLSSAIPGLAANLVRLRVEELDGLATRW